MKPKTVKIKTDPNYYIMNSTLHLTFLGFTNLMYNNGFKVVKNELNDEKWIIDEVEKTAIKIDIEKEKENYSKVSSGNCIIEEKYLNMLLYNRAVRSAAKKFPRFREILEKTEIQK